MVKGLNRCISVIACTIILAGCNAAPNAPVAKHGLFSTEQLSSLCHQSHESTVIKCEFGVEKITRADHYQVEIRYKGKTKTKIYAESRRLMLDSAVSGDVSSTKFVVNSRTPDGQPLQQDAYVGTPGLTLWIAQGWEAINSIKVEPVVPTTRVFVIGDSTVCDQNPQWNRSAGSRYSGWGQILPSYLADTVSVVNYADSGEGTATFDVANGALFVPINEQLSAGDYVLIQLGHNDKTTSSEMFSARLTSLVKTIKAKGGAPILITPMVRNLGLPLASQHQWPNLDIRSATIAVSDAQRVPLIDLMALSDSWVTALGRDAAQAYFVPGDRTHSNEEGAAVFAQMLVNDIYRQQLPFAKYLIHNGRNQ